MGELTIPLVPKLKLKNLLISRGINYQQLSDRIQQLRPGYVLGVDRISRICTGKHNNYNLQTAVLIAKALGVRIDDIVDEMD